jgi:hypothetical protein
LICSIAGPIQNVEVFWGLRALSASIDVTDARVFLARMWA